MRHKLLDLLPAAISGLFGAAFSATIAGAGVLDPTSVRWVFQGDWQVHFLGWHFFRNESWHLPPGALTSYLEPIGSALGYTDSIPLAAFVLKPFAAVLPNPMQYLGIWLVLCFVLQGVFGAILMSAWTKDRLLRTCAGCLFVLVPTLLARMVHPALCSHWVLLWALWIAVREPVLPSARAWRQHLSVALVSGLLHPYLAVMVLTILTAASAKRVVLAGRAAMFESAGLFTAGVGATLMGWWSSGLLTLTSRTELATDGLGRFSMNLLGLVNPGSRSRFVPALRWISPEQQHEGFHYLGAALIVVCVVAAIRLVTAGGPSHRGAIPLVIGLASLALFSVSPRVTFGDRVVVDVLPYVGGSSPFRASARFFWPVTYALIGGAMGVVATTLRRRTATTLLAGAIALQLFELQPWYAGLYHGLRNPIFLGANLPVPSGEWPVLLQQFERVRMYLPEFCGGPSPVAMPFVAFLAGASGLGLNDGFAARMDTALATKACEQFRADLASGVTDDHTVYLVSSALEASFRERAVVRCHVIDGVTACVSQAAADRLSLTW
jgi:Family of unknown function (DUF6311)